SCPEGTATTVPPVTAVSCAPAPRPNPIMATATAPLVIRRPPADAVPRPGRAARDVLQLGTVLVIARPASRPSEWNIVVLFPRIGELLRPQRGEGPRHPLAGGMGHDHLVDEALFGGHEGVGEAVLVVL